MELHTSHSKDMMVQNGEEGNGLANEMSSSNSWLLPSHSSVDSSKSGEEGKDGGIQMKECKKTGDGAETDGNESRESGSPKSFDSQSSIGNLDIKIDSLFVLLNVIYFPRRQDFFENSQYVDSFQIEIFTCGSIKLPPA